MLMEVQKKASGLVKVNLLLDQKKKGKSIALPNKLNKK